MKTLVRRRLPEFNATQSESLKGSYDFIGLNYYSSYYVINIPFSNKPAHLSYSSDYYGTLSSKFISFTFALICKASFKLSNLFVYPFAAEKNGVPIGPTVRTR